MSLKCQARLGHTIVIRSPQLFTQDPNMYFDEDGRPCDSTGKLKGVDYIEHYVLDTPEKVAAFNEGRTQDLLSLIRK